MRVIVMYGMKAHNMAMAEMGYVVIDAGGRIRARRTDREMGEHAEDIIKAVRQPAPTAA
jgi:peroxiredoxin